MRTRPSWVLTYDACDGTPAAMKLTGALAIFLLTLVSLFAPLDCASVESLHLERSPPKRVDVEAGLREYRPDFVYNPYRHRGFPSHVSVFDFEEAEPLSLRERVRWHAFHNLGVDQSWRIERKRPTDLRVTEHFATVDLLGGITRVGEYYTKILIGGQPVRVQVDTGSSTLALPVAECRECLPSDLRYNMKRSKNKNARVVSCSNKMCAPDKCAVHKCSRCSAVDACCSTENPSGCGFFLKYGDGSFAHGALMIDELTWVSRGARNLSSSVVFGGILKDAPTFERPLVDGIMGFAYQALACNPTCVEPPFQQMVKAGVVDDLFTICTTPRGGKLVLGEIDPKMIKGKVSYVPLALSTVPTYYTVNVSSAVGIGDGELPLPNFRYGVVDSGTTLIAVTKLTFLLILQYMQEHYCHIPHLCGPKTWFLPSACVRISDDTLKQLPTFVFHLGPNREFSLTLPPEDYMLQTVNHGVSVRCVGFMALDKLAAGTDIIFGNTIMRYVTVYDRKNKRMGFGLSSGSCGAPPDCSSYTRCNECAAEEQCAYNFKTKRCSSRDSVGYHLFSFPVCTGAGCACGLGQQAFFVYGIATGFVACFVALGAGFGLVALCAAFAKRTSVPSLSSYEPSLNDSSRAAATEPLPLMENEKL